MTILSKNVKIEFISTHFKLISGVISEMTGPRRRRLVRKYPAYSLENSLSVPSIIFSENAGLPIDRSLLASSLGTTVSSSSFTTKLASSEEYGLTKGRYNASEVSITELGLSCVAYQSEIERKNSLLKASLSPDLFNKLGTLLSGKELPEEEYFSSLLIRNFQIHPDQTKEVINIYKSNIALTGNIPYGNPLIIEDLQESSKDMANSTGSDRRFLYAMPVQEINKKNSMLILSTQNMETKATQINETLDRVGLKTNLFIYNNVNFQKIFDLNKSNGPFVIGIVIEGKANPEDNFLLGLAQGISNNNTIVITENSDYSKSNLKHINPAETIPIKNDVNSAVIKILEILNSTKSIKVIFKTL